MEPLGPPNRPKIGAKSPLDTSCCQNPRLSRNNIKTKTKSFKMTPRRPPRRAKIDPRRLQDDLRNLLVSSSFLTFIFRPLGSDFGLILAPFWTPQIGQVPRLTTPQAAKNDPNNPCRPKMASRPPKKPSRPLQDAPRGAQEPPETLQNDQKSTQDTTQTIKNRPKTQTKEDNNTTQLYSTLRGSFSTGLP